MKEIPAFDVGVGVVGILDLHTDFCVPFRGSCMSNGARQTLDCDGIVISFSGNLYVLPKLARLTGVDASDSPPLHGAHYDKSIEASRDCWPARDGENPFSAPTWCDQPRSIGSGGMLVQGGVRGRAGQVAEPDGRLGDRMVSGVGGRYARVLWGRAMLQWRRRASIRMWASRNEVKISRLSSPSRNRALKLST